MSTTCNITAAIALDCLDSISGIKTLWVSSNADLGTITAGATAGITALVGATGAFYEIQVAKDVASNLINIGSKKAGVTPVYANLPSGVPTYSTATSGGILNNPIVLIGGVALIAILLMSRSK